MGKVQELQRVTKQPHRQLSMVKRSTPASGILIAFYGPDTRAHPGIFPHNVDAARWSIQEWLKFNYRAAWGSEKFEESIEDLIEPFDEFNTALEPLGGHPVTLDSLASIEAAAARGTMAFRRVTSLKPLQAAMEAITEAVSTDEVNDQIATLKEALGGLSEAVESSESVTAPKSYKLLVAATDKMAATAADRLVNAEANIEKATNFWRLSRS